VVSTHPDPRLLTDAEAEALLGAYALDACDPAETDAVREVLARHPDLATEAARLIEAAAWLGAVEALEPPSSLRSGVAVAARRSRPGRADPALDVYLATSSAFGDAIDALDAAGDDVLDAPTANGLGAHDLVVHMAAQESLFAQELGVPTLPDVVETDIVTRTRALLPRFARGAPGDGTFDGAAALWRTSVATSRDWAAAHPHDTVVWRGVAMPRDDALVVRAFEAWIHTRDLDAVLGREPHVPVPAHLSVMADLASRLVPLQLALAGLPHPGATVRLELTGAGGGAWMVACDGGVPAGDAATPDAPTPDAVVRVDVVEWCLRVGDRVTGAELDVELLGDARIGRDLVEAAPALATL
jgi:uncharacterized protein (TIGR03083 family)